MGVIRSGGDNMNVSSISQTLCLLWKLLWFGTI